MQLEGLNKIIIINLNSFIICIATIRQSHKKERKFYLINNYYLRTLQKVVN